MSGQLELWTIYAKPRDFPDGYVLRRSVVIADRVAADAKASYFAALEHARAAVPPGLHRMERQPDDDPVIVEVWL